MLKLPKKGVIKQNAPLILTVVSVVGIAGTTVLSVRAGMEAERILTEHKSENLTIVDKTKLTWKAYIFCVASAILTGTCVVMSHKLSRAQIAALSSIVATGATTISQYRNKVREVIGEEQEKILYDEASENASKATLITEPHQFSTDNAVRLWKDDYSKQYFYATDLEVISALFTLNTHFGMDYHVTFNDWLDLLPLSKYGAQVEHYKTDKEDGDTIGWSIENNARLKVTPETMVCVHELYNVFDYDIGREVNTIVFEIPPSRKALEDYGYI